MHVFPLGGGIEYYRCSYHCPCPACLPAHLPICLQATHPKNILDPMFLITPKVPVTLLQILIPLPTLFIVSTPTKPSRWTMTDVVDMLCIKLYRTVSLRGQDKLCPLCHAVSILATAAHTLLTADLLAPLVVKRILVEEDAKL